MRNEGAVVIKKAATAIGVGLLEQALEREGQKGCSGVLCLEPVALEPPFQTFDAAHILGSVPGITNSDKEAPQSASAVNYVTFDLYPAEEDQLSITWMETMLRCLSVLFGPLAFELYGTAGSVWVRFAVPHDQVAGLKAALLGHFPALRLQLVNAPFPEDPPRAVNELYPVGPYHRSLTLLGKEGASPLGIAAHVLAELKEDESGLFQVLLQPAHPDHDWHYNVENLATAEERASQLSQLGGLSTDFSYDRKLPPLPEPSVREKVRIDVAFFAAIARYAVWHTDKEATDAFLQGMRVATGMLRFGKRAWRVLSNKDLEAALSPPTVHRMTCNRQTHRPGVMLTSQEVASLVHIPNARTLAMLAAIKQRFGFEWQPFEKDRTSTSCLGLNHFAGEEHKVEIPLETRLRHTYIAGTTGSGKSKLIERMAVDDALNGLGFCLVDPHGDLASDVLSRLPEERLPDLVYVSFAEPGTVPRWNPFESDVPAGKLADDIARAFLAQTTTTGPRMEHNFRMLSYVVHALKGTLEDFAELAGKTPRGEALRDHARARIDNPQVQRFLGSELPSYKPSDLSSVTNKLSRLLLDDSLGAMFRNKENTLHPREWMDTGNIVLVNLAAGHIGTDHARFVGSLLVSLIYRAALTRAELPHEQRRPFVLYVDEFQQLQAATLSEILSEGRKYGLAAVLAHQERGQLGTELSHALGNCATKVLFRPSEHDLPYVHRLLGARVEADDIRTLSVGQAFVACGSRFASLTTELCTEPTKRDPQETASRYAAAHYAQIDGKERQPARRPRVYDTFGSGA